MMPRMVDRSVARMIAYKRLVTGTLGLGAGVVTIGIAIAHSGSPPPSLVLAIAIFFGGGAWALRDGLRLRRELRR